MIYLVIDLHTMDIALTGITYFATNSKNTGASGIIITPPPMPAVIGIPDRTVRTRVPLSLQDKWKISLYASMSFVYT
jgi:hypothetical protein